MKIRYAGKKWTLKKPLNESSNQEFFKESALIDILFKHNSDAVVITDILGIIQDANPMAAQLTGWSIDQMKGQPFLKMFEFIDEADHAPHVDSLMKFSRSWQSEKNLTHRLLISRNGTEYFTELKVQELLGSNGSVIGAVTFLRDITQLKNLGLQISWHNQHDPITGLPNRLYFEEILQTAITDVKHQRRSHMLCQFDIDHFKLLNDTCGSFAGDQLLGQLASLMQENIRRGDTLARLGGDEFGLLLQQCSIQSAQKIAKKLQQQVEDFRFFWKGKKFGIGLAVGLVQINQETQDIETLLSQADTACFTAKNHGQQKIQVFSDNNQEIEGFKNHQAWSLKISAALEENRFQLYRQPIVSSVHDSCIPHHYEVLVRMISPSGEIVSPNHFIPTAELYQSMLAIDQWIIDQAFHKLENSLNIFHQKQQSHSIYSINLSGTSLSDPQFLESLKEKVSRINYPHHCLCFEITETAAILNIDLVKGAMESLRELGCKFSLDDFGAGLSSFGYLKLLPVDYLKIDGKFIREIDNDAFNITVVESMNHIGHTLGLKTIAEMVENSTSVRRLREIGVDFLQGFAIGKPEPWE